MYFVEIENGKCTGNYSKDVRQSSYKKFIIVEELPAETIDGFEVIGDKIVKPDFDVDKLLADIEIYEEYLANTDWYITRKIENGKPVPEDVLAKREEARNIISNIRDKLEY